MMLPKDIILLIYAINIKHTKQNVMHQYLFEYEFDYKSRMWNKKYNFLFNYRKNYSNDRITWPSDRIYNIINCDVVGDLSENY